jgi:flagellar basal-body rod protein FlgG
MTLLERELAAPDLKRGPITDKEFYRLDGRDQSFVITDGTYTNFKPGSYRVTDNPMDVALDGPGFFEVSTPEGIRLTKQGSFKLATDGRLVTAQGYPVLSSQPGGLANALPASAVQPSQGGLSTQGGVAAGQTDPAVMARVIDLKDAAMDSNTVSRGPLISINKQGEIFSGDQKITQLSVVEFSDPKLLRKDRSQLFLNPDPANQKTGSDPGSTRVLQGVLETSNVNPIEEMTNLIKAHRAYDQNLKAMRVYDQMMEKESNEIGRLR